MKGVPDWQEFYLFVVLVKTAAKRGRATKKNKNCFLDLILIPTCKVYIIIDRNIKQFINIFIISYIANC